ncbi:adenosylcobinamide-GDP ribazoletransferase [Defluviimonas salinarum]|uniref:Adenosylcobinamide-GDP ribazoletransferase n=1 Tax=Defluviimonas salinarum TaxID=2992147 RepID=A0ABT3J3E4_9RHOB|nr:adenosylcobinamide-GDP ribazoletransferase [Defluviimonas salinarum]MCW3781975.1 adenosylcobinamide-GDP ribazoletransferase [Defluviimonas salinarum]
MRPSRAGEIRLAFMLLSRLPAGRIEGEAPAMAASSWAWPLVGVAVGAIMALVCGSALWLGLPPLMAALLALAAGALATGAMHEDGLADLADGFGGGRDRARKLEIMRDSRIGSYGVVALVLALAFRAIGISTLAEAGSATAALVGIAAASRAVLPAALVMMPAARGDGLGHSAAGSGPAPALVAAGIGFLCLLPLGFGTAVVAGGAMALAATLLAGLALRQIGGQTGDVMGAMQQVAEVAGWAVLSASV